MLLVTHSADKRLRLYRVSIDFQQMVFNLQHVKTIDHCSPLEQTGNSSPMNYHSTCQLSHLQILPPGPETRHMESKDPFILAIFSQIPDQSEPTAREGLSTILVRWEFCSRKPKLNTSFEQLVPKKLSANFPGDLPVGVKNPHSNLQRLLMLSSLKLPSKDSEML